MYQTYPYPFPESEDSFWFKAINGIKYHVVLRPKDNYRFYEPYYDTNLINEIIFDHEGFTHTEEDAEISETITKRLLEIITRTQNTIYFFVCNDGDSLTRLFSRWFRDYNTDENIELLTEDFTNSGIHIHHGAILIKNSILYASRKDHFYKIKDFI